MALGSGPLTVILGFYGATHIVYEQPVHEEPRQCPPIMYEACHANHMEEVLILAMWNNDSITNMDPEWNAYCAPCRR